MRWPVCVACGVPKNLQHHHLVPRTVGGADAETNLITLCGRCHGLLHSMTQPVGGVEHRKLVSYGIRRAEQSGAKLGPKNPPLSSFIEKYRTPRDELIIRLSAVDGLMNKEITALRMGDFLLDTVKPCRREIVLDSETTAIARNIISSEGIQGEWLAEPLTQKSANTLGVWLFRQRKKTA
jgi:hypothetical protein